MLLMHRSLLAMHLSLTTSAWHAAPFRHPGLYWVMRVFSLLCALMCCCAVLCLQGYLTIADLYTFFREIHALWVNMGEYAELEIYDVLDEIMDMVKPATPGRITKADLQACKMSGTMFSILANVDQFYTYNFRCGCLWAT